MGPISSFMSHAWVQHLIMGALGGAGAAAKVDYDAFRNMSLTDFEKYNWKLAIFRWVQGAVIGGVTTSAMGGWIQ